MRIILGIDTREIGWAASAHGGPITVGGDDPEAVNSLLQFYARRLGEASEDLDKLLPDDLLKYVSDRLNGRTWARVDDPTSALPHGAEGATT